MNKIVLAFVSVAALLAHAGCSSDSTTNPTPPAAGGNTVTISSNQFSPASITIKKGESVKWVWNGGTHNVTSGTSCTSDSKFTSGPPKSSGDFSQTFDTAGTFDYFCQPHCSGGMTGKVIVQ